MEGPQLRYDLWGVIDGGSVAINIGPVVFDYFLVAGSVEGPQLRYDLWGVNDGGSVAINKGLMVFDYVLVAGSVDAS